MAEIVNLRLARKRKARAQKELQASQNHALHGRTRAERTSAETERTQRDRHLDGHRKSDDE